MKTLSLYAVDHQTSLLCSTETIEVMTLPRTILKIPIANVQSKESTVHERIHLSMLPLSTNSANFSDSGSNTE
jgi:hypothetical protein